MKSHHWRARRDSSFATFKKSVKRSELEIERQRLEDEEMGRRQRQKGINNVMRDSDRLAQ